MNLTEQFSNPQNTSEGFSNDQSTSKRVGGVGRGKKYAGAEIPSDAFVGDDYIVMEDAYALFDSEGERRSMRMIAEYCKTGELVCDYDSDDKRWHITQESVENKISKIKALNARKASATPPLRTSEHFSESPATAPRTAEELPPRNESVQPPSEDVKKLEQEIFDLKIINKGKDYFIAKLQEERAEFITKIETNSRLIGQLETKVLQLGAPRHETTAPRTPLDHASTYRDVGDDVSSFHSNPPASDIPLDGSLSNNSTDNYEHTPQ